MHCSVSLPRVSYYSEEKNRHFVTSYPMSWTLERTHTSIDCIASIDVEGLQGHLEAQGPA
jgi:hypothetical protein